MQWANRHQQAAHRPSDCVRNVRDWFSRNSVFIGSGWSRITHSARRMWSEKWSGSCSGDVDQFWTPSSALHVQCESKKSPPPRGPDIFHFFHKRLRIFNPFFTHLLYVPIYARLQIFIQLSPILMKLCHIKRDYPVHIICSKCPSLPETHALTRLRKSLIALLIVVCGK